MIFVNGQLIFPDVIRAGLELEVHSGRITQIRTQTRHRNEKVIDLCGAYLAPGFLDLHLHGAVGRDTMEATPDAFRAICDYHASGGTTSFLLATVTAPITEILNVLRFVKESQSKMPQIIGIHVEGPFISKAKSGAQCEEFIIEPTPRLIEDLLQFAAVIKIVTLAPEVNGALNLIDRLCEKNICISGGHSNASEFESRVAFEHGMRHVTHTFNCMSSAQDRGVYRVAGLLEFALSEPKILCELIADGRHVSATLMKLLYRAKGAKGICLVTDAIAGAGLPVGSHFSLGGRECMVGDGVCLLADRSALAGSSSRMIDLIRTLVHLVDVPLHEAVAMATINPACALGLVGKKGCLAPAADADLVVLSPDLEVNQTFFCGDQIFQNTAKSAL